MKRGIAAPDRRAPPSRRRRRADRVAAFLLPLACAALATPAHAQDAIETYAKVSEAADADGAPLVELRFLNGSDVARTLALPDRIAGRIEQGERVSTVWLERAGDMPVSVEIAPGAFARARYRLAGPVPATGALLSIPAWHSQRIALAALPAEPQAAAPALADSDPAPTPLPLDLPPPPPSDRASGNEFADNLSIYEPIYAVFGPGTDTAARIQISFKYRLFGSNRGSASAWRDGLHFAYTQRMFWDLGAYSLPFRNIDYRPELIYIAPAATLNDRLTLSAQLGLRHQSNGLDGPDTRSINSLYVAPMAALALGRGWRLVAAPRLIAYFGDTSENPGLPDFRGHSSLYIEIGQDDGLRLTADARLNYRTGRGAIDAALSYPLPRLLGGGPDVYLYGQAFAGFGENLLDYDRRMTRLRVGLAFVR